MTSRDLILKKLMAARKDFPHDGSAFREAPRASTEADGGLTVLPRPTDLTDTFVRKASELLCTVYTEEGWNKAWERLAALVTERNWKSAVTWDETTFPSTGLYSVLSKAGCVRADPKDWPNADVGITSADAAIAATGTLILLSGPGKPRSASLLPYSHVALVPESRLVPCLEDWLAARHFTDRSLEGEETAQVVTAEARAGEPVSRSKPPLEHTNLSSTGEVRRECSPSSGMLQQASTVLISGPSRSGDIEMIVTLGVHGPGEVYVILVLGA